MTHILRMSGFPFLSNFFPLFGSVARLIVTMDRDNKAGIIRIVSLQDSFTEILSSQVSYFSEPVPSQHHSGRHETVVSISVPVTVCGHSCDQSTQMQWSESKQISTDCQFNNSLTLSSGIR